MPGQERKIHFCGATPLDAMRPLSVYSHTQGFVNADLLRLAYLGNAAYSAPTHPFGSPSEVHSLRSSCLLTPAADSLKSCILRYYSPSSVSVYTLTQKSLKVNM